MGILAGSQEGNVKIAIIGAGIAGCFCAKLLKKAHKITVFEQRSHIGGMCYDGLVNNVLVQQYGPHIFHTDDVELMCHWAINFSPYIHKVVANTRLGIIPIPYNDESEKITGRLSDDEIVDLVFRNYSYKQWGVELDDLPLEVRSRLNVRRGGSDCRYFVDQYQGIPATGYTPIFDLWLHGTSLFVREWHTSDISKDFDLVIYTGMLDEYFGYAEGHLPYRSLIHSHSVGPRSMNSVINECSDRTGLLRRYDNAILSSDPTQTSVVTSEFAVPYDETNDPMYPMEFDDATKRMADAYRDMASLEKKVLFIGRLATYKYLDMDDTMRQCIDVLKRNKLI